MNFQFTWMNDKKYGKLLTKNKTLFSTPPQYFDEYYYLCEKRVAKK